MLLFTMFVVCAPIVFAAILTNFGGIPEGLAPFVGYNEYIILFTRLLCHFVV